MINKFWIINSFGTDFSWVKEYTDNYIVYDKTNQLEETDKIKHQVNVGYNIYDYFSFIINNYINLPDVCVFIKANVFRHCKKEKFDILIQNNCFTPLESYEDEPESHAHKKDTDGGYMETNNSWYLTHYGNVNQIRYLKTFDELMNKFFIDYIYVDWVRFSPGANYIVPKENILFYTKEFYYKLNSFLDYCQLPAEAHALERALYYIFSNAYKERR